MDCELKRLNDLLDVRSLRALRELVDLYGWDRIESAFGVLLIEMSFGKSSDEKLDG